MILRTRHHRFALLLLVGISLCIFLFGIEYAFALSPSQTFKPLAGLPFLKGTYTLPALLNALYKLSIIVGALLAVVMIAIAGFQYMSPTVGGVEKAKANITNALFGLLILLSTALILKTISGDVKLDVLTLQPINTSSGSQVQPQPEMTAAQVAAQNIADHTQVLDQLQQNNAVGDRGTTDCSAGPTGFACPANTTWGPRANNVGGCYCAPN